MGNSSRNHHFVPQGYLAGFTSDGTSSGQFHVLDVITKKVFKTKPRNVTAARDFNAISVPGQRPDALERAFGEFEDKAIGVTDGSASIKRCQTMNSLGACY